MDAVEAHRLRLMEVLNRYVPSLTQRPGVSGVLLYGSLALGDLTTFSDIDLVVLYDENAPDCEIEQRVVDGIKIDLLLFPMKQVSDLADPQHKVEVNFPFNYVVDALKRGDERIVLHDPTGELAKAYAAMRIKAKEEAVDSGNAAEFYQKHIKTGIEERLQAAQELGQKGERGQALEKAVEAAQWSSFPLRHLAHRKRIADAAEALGIPEYTDLHHRAMHLEVGKQKRAEAVWKALKELWEWTLREVSEPVDVALRAAGVAEPAKLELTGEYKLFWPGYRVTEYGRVLSEIDQSLKWSRFELDQGNPIEAMNTLWGCWESKATTERWQNLAKALRDAGYDVSGIVEEKLQLPEYLDLAATLDAAIQTLNTPDVSPSLVEEAISLAEQMEAMVGGLPILAPREP